VEQTEQIPNFVHVLSNETATINLGKLGIA
jgi:hypothetical protein